MISQSSAEIWLIIVAIGIGTYLIRFSFLGLMGATEFPPWALKLLRYTPVAIIPALVAPLVVWPAATAGETDPARLTAAIVTMGVGIWTRNAIWGMVAGGTTLLLLFNVFP